MYLETVTFLSRGKVKLYSARQTNKKTGTEYLEYKADIGIIELLAKLELILRKK